MNYFYRNLTSSYEHLLFALGLWLCANVSFGQLNADFNANPISGCSPLVVQFTDLSTGGPTSWSWNFGNSGTSTAQNPSTIYSTPGLYTVTLTISNGINSDTEIKTNFINVYNKPQTNFTTPNDTFCVGETVTFTDATILGGGPPISTWNWDFGDGNTQTVTVPATTHVYTTPGTYPVSLIVFDPNNCSGTIVKNIVIVPAPVASFTASPTGACTPPLTVNFTNTSSSTGTTTYFWNFGNGNTSTAQNPSATYTLPGAYTVTLIVTQGNCTDTLVIPNLISIQNITPSFTATPTVVCTGQPVNFTNTSSPPAVSSNWNFGDGNTSTAINPTNTYTTAGTYTVTLTATDANGCTGTYTSTITVNQTPVASFIADTTVACSVPFTVNFTSTSTGGVSYLWDFGDGNTSALQNPSNTYTASGTYNVTLIVTNPNGTCSDTVIINNFIVIDFPVATFTYSPDSGCVPLTVNFNSTSTSAIDPIVTYSWNFGDGNTAVTATPAISNTYTAASVYTVTLVITTANGCSDTFVCVNCIKVGTPPFANFGILNDTVCFGLPVTFIDSSVNATGWFWQFGDGGTSTLQNPIYTYGDTGTFQVTLIAYNNGCADTAVIQPMVILPPKAQFTFTLSCTNYYTVGFTSTSVGADSLFWNFGDGTQDSSNNINPVHTYPTRGPFTVTLTAYNYSTGCVHSITGTFTIAEPIAGFGMNNSQGCYPLTVVFSDSSQDASQWWWNFGDLSTTADTSVAQNPSYVYNVAGQYVVTLIITDVNGCKDTLQDTITSLGPTPYFYADTLTGCTPFTVTFIDTSVSDSALVQWIWNYGDGTIDTVYNDTTIHVYTVPGLYSVTMSVMDTNGCVKTVTIVNYIQPTFPIPAFTVDPFACKGDVLTFNASATSVIGGTFIWIYGDGQIDTTTATSITHTYLNDSLYVVTLIVTDTNGCVDSIQDTVLILQPTAFFNDSVINMGCGTLTIQFQDSSWGYVNAWNWNFGDGGNSTSQNPSHTYTQPGYYTVTLVVTNGGGCTDTVQMDSVFVPGPIGNFTFTPVSGCNPLTVCFDANSANTQVYVWDFGDGIVITTTSDTICHTYTNAGSFNPQLVLQNTLPNGNPCSLLGTNITGGVTVTNVINTTLSQSIITLNEDSLSFVNATFSGGIGPYTFSWVPATGINCDTCSSVILVGTGDTIMYVFTVYDASGCIGMDSILVLSMPCLEEEIISNVFSPNGDGNNDVFYIPGVCASEKYRLQIFDRWGVLLFSTTQRNNGWDGRSNAGVEMQDGVYYYVLTIEEKVLKGVVHLLR